jgi:predicted Na+-dependent transporter
VSVPLSVFILSAIFHAAFRITPRQVAGQVFVAQLVPLGVGIAIRAIRPSLGAWLEPRLARLSNVLLLVLAALCLYGLWPQLVAIGWMPAVAGVVLTAGSLAVGSAFAWRDAAARPQGAIAAAMRNPGLALYIAAVNHAAAGVIAAVFAFALGATIVITAYIVWRGRK